MSNLLVVDDEQSICWALAKLGQGMGHQVATAASAEEGLRIAGESPPDLIILDVRLPGMDGLQALQAFRERLPHTPVIIITAFGQLEIAVQAVRGGAFEYLLKPFDLSDIRAAIRRSLQSVTAVNETSTAVTSGDMVGATPIMQALFKQIALAADSTANVLVQGESGVGKELVARGIHRYSQKADAPFVAVNVAALSPTLAESELFGHVEGAFTGAARGREGLLAVANGGTLFLDEVAEIPLTVQVKLLRALEQNEVLPVGADTPVETNFRVIAATNRDPKAMCAAGEFRQDLYFRLAAFEISVPPLRERVEDIPLLASHFASQLGAGGLSLAEETIAEMKKRPWSGNVRELRNAIEHVGVVARSGVVFPEHLPACEPATAEATGDAQPGDRLADASKARSIELLNDPAAFGTVYETLLQEVEAPLLSNALKQFAGEFAPAARALGLHRTTLKRRVDQLEITPEDEQSP